MNELFTSFQSNSKEEWEKVLLKELKGESLESLMKVNKVEEIAFPSYYHPSDQKVSFSDPGKLPYTRGFFENNNQWTIANSVRISSLKSTNERILELLMTGTTHLILEAIDEQPIDFFVLLNEVGMNYIHTSFYAKTKEQVEQFCAYAGDAPINICFDNNQELLHLPIKPTCKLFHIDASLVQFAGGTTWQELAIALSEGHEILVQLLDRGVSCDDACAQIHFTVGIGSKFYFEVSKIRAFRTAWSKIVSQYDPTHTCSHATSITAKTGWMTISLKDPYTNLLRQTTQALSACVAGAQHIHVQAYDWFSTDARTTFTQRMATNISLLLQHESYLGLVIDPAGGAYALDDLTASIAERAWSLFQWIERNGGISNPEVVAELKKNILEKVALRKEAFLSKEEKLIGLNVFPNPETVQSTWVNLPKAWQGLDVLLLETIA